MASIVAVSTAVPEHAYSNQEIAAAAGGWLRDDNESSELFQRFLKSAQTENRHFAITLEEVLSLNGARRRAGIFEELGPELGAQSIAKALAASGVKSRDLETFLFTSCTCPSIPSIDGILIDQMKMDRSISRIPIYQHGCAGGVIGLSLANKFATQGGNVLLTSVELCSLVFHPKDHTRASLVGSAIFGDGSASAVVSPSDKGLVICDTRSTLLPNTRHLMGYDILDDGSHLRLDRELPMHLADAVPIIAANFLADNNLSKEDVPWWLFHPGGVKILNFLEELFELEPNQCHWSRKMLRDYGNLSSSSVLFVLADFLNDHEYKDGDHVLLVGVGPGLTIELILFQYRS